MAATPASPTGYILQQGNGQVYLSWNLVAGATSYAVNRSLDGVTFTSYATPVNPNYLDTAVTVGTQYWYQVAAVNGSGTSPFTTAQSIVPAMSGQRSLGEVRLMCQQRADRVNSQFVTTPEWNQYIVQAQYELYDLLITCNQSYYIAPTAAFISNGNSYLYPLPD